MGKGSRVTASGPRGGTTQLSGHEAGDLAWVCTGVTEPKNGKRVTGESWGGVGSHLMRRRREGLGSCPGPAFLDTGPAPGRAC